METVRAGKHFQILPSKVAVKPILIGSTADDDSIRKKSSSSKSRSVEVGSFCGVDKDSKDNNESSKNTEKQPQCPETAPVVSSKRRFSFTKIRK